jgi:hypothetical protein
MLNFRVTSLYALLEQLRHAGVRIDPNQQGESFGRFAWIYDLEKKKRFGNPGRL